MKSWTILPAALVVLSISGAVTAAQNADHMANPMAMDKTYTGCVAAGAMKGTFMLNHATAMAMDHSAMGKDAMKPEAMKKDAMAKDAMGKEMSMVIDSKSIDLSKHIGHKVSVTGSDGAMAKPDAMGKGTPSFAVSAISMVATSCGM